MPIMKAEVTVTVFLEAETPAAAQEEIQSGDLSRLAYEMDEGSMVGSMKVALPTIVKNDDLEAELSAIGSDPSFFSSLDSED